MSRSDTQDGLRIFISHQWADKQLADRLARDLESFADVWMDYRNLRPGDGIQQTIDEALARTDVVLVIWTAHAARSAGVAAEIATSRRLRLRVIPCLCEYDEDGRPSPPLPESLADVLGVDFHHYGSGLAQIADFIVNLESERLPESARTSSEHPSRRLLDYLRGYLSYLANYRDLRGVPDERAVWVGKIIDEVERFLRDGGNPALVHALLETARRSEVDDPEGIGELIRRLEAALQVGEEGSGRDRAAESVDPGDRPRAAAITDADELSRRLRATVGAEHVPAAVRAVERYLASALPALRALHAYAIEAGSPAGTEVVDYLCEYLTEPNDLISDDMGRFGRLDDAWLILNTAYRLIESGLVPVASVPVEWASIVPTDGIVRAVLPEDVLETLTAAVFEMLQLIRQEVVTYDPSFHSNGRRYAPHLARPSGGTWEDRMNRMLLGTGLSVDA